jgi:uncharacterized membrane protein required for colicin V production
MGLDLALGIFVLFGAIRGWRKGFLLQAIRLSGLVACVYAAGPVRDQLKPYVLPHLPTIRPELVDRLLWWSSAAASYVVLVGLATLILKFSRRQPFGIAEPNRGDQSAGLLLGALKGLVVASFLVAALQQHAVPRLGGVAWAEEQARTSQVLKWNAQYEPAAKIWGSPPVQQFVAHVRRMGLASPPHGPTSPEEAPDSPKPLQAEGSRPPRLTLPSTPPGGLDPAHAGLDDLARAMKAIEDELEQGLSIPSPN